MDLNLREYLIATFDASETADRRYTHDQKWFFPQAGVYVCGGLSKMWSVIVAIRDEYPNTPLMEDLCYSDRTPRTRYIYEFICSDEERMSIEEEYKSNIYIFRGKYVQWNDYIAGRYPRLTPYVLRYIGDNLPQMLENTKLMQVPDQAELRHSLLRSPFAITKAGARDWIMHNPPGDLTMRQYSKKFRADTHGWVPSLFSTMAWCIYPNSTAAKDYNV